MKMFFVAAAALALAGCGEVTDRAAELPEKADAAVQGRAVVDAVASAVDVEAAKSIAKGAAESAAREALGEIVPPEGVAAAAAVIDERALVNGLDKAVNEEAVADAVRGAVTVGEAKMARTPAE